MTIYNDVTTRTASADMPNAACAGSVKRTGALRKPAVHRSTRNIATSSQEAEMNSRRSSGPSDARVRTRSVSRGREYSAEAETGQSASRRRSSSTVTSRDASQAETNSRRSNDPSEARGRTRSVSRGRQSTAEAETGQSASRRASSPSVTSRDSSRKSTVPAQRSSVPSPSRWLSPRSPRNANSPSQAAHTPTVMPSNLSCGTNSLVRRPSKPSQEPRSPRSPRSLRSPRSSRSPRSPRSPRRANSSPPPAAWGRAAKTSNLTTRDAPRRTAAPVRRPSMPSQSPSTRESTRSPRRASLSSPRSARGRAPTSTVTPRNASRATAAPERRLSVQSLPSPTTRASPRRASSPPRTACTPAVSSRCPAPLTTAAPVRRPSVSSSLPFTQSSTWLSPRSPRTANSSSRPAYSSSMTSRDASRTTAAPVRRQSIPSQFESPRAVYTSPTTSNKASRSKSYTVSPSSVSLSPAPRRRSSTSSNRGSAPIKSSSVVACGPQTWTANSKPVIISGRGVKTAASATAAIPTTSTYDGGVQKNASMRSRIGIAPNLLLPNCYLPGKTTPRTPMRSFSVNATCAGSSPDVAATPEKNSPIIRRSISAQERQAALSLRASTIFDEYPEPPPENVELNSRMEMLFEEYRKVERGFIFSSEQFNYTSNSTSSSNGSLALSSRSPTYDVGQTATAGKRIGLTIGSMRAKSVGNLSVSSSSTTLVSPRQQRNDQNKASPLSSPGRSLSMSGSISGRPTTPNMSQSFLGTCYQSVSSTASPRLPRKSAIIDVARASPRKQTHVAAVPVGVCSADECSPPLSARYCGGGGVTRASLDSVPALLYGASRRLQEVSAASTPVSSAYVAATQPPVVRATTSTCSVPRPVEQVHANNNCISTYCGRKAISNESQRQTSSPVFNNNSKVSSQGTQSPGHLAEDLLSQLADIERRSRQSTANVRSRIPKPVSCSGRNMASPRHENRDPLITCEPVLRRFDSGVDIAAAELSPSDDCVGGALEAVVQRLSASLESCTMALLSDNYGTSPVRRNESNTVDNLNDIDDEYY